MVDKGYAALPKILPGLFQQKQSERTTVNGADEEQPYANILPFNASGSLQNAQSQRGGAFPASSSFHVESPKGPHSGGIPAKHGKEKVG